MSDERVSIPQLHRVPESEWRWFGDPGHFICSDYCRFHLTTKVGDYLVSTVGKYVPDGDTREIYARSRGVELVGRGDEREADYMRKVGYEKLGSWGTYETMVFLWTEPCNEAECGGLAHVGGDSLDSERYENAKDATEGHYRFCEKAARGRIPERENV